MSFSVLYTTSIIVSIAVGLIAQVFIVLFFASVMGWNIIAGNKAEWPLHFIIIDSGAVH